jgi:hypothetical protein
MTLVFDASLGAARATFPGVQSSRRGLFGLRLLTASLYLLQPLARVYGRLAEGLTPWRRHGALRFAVPRSRQLPIWSEQWHSPEEWVRLVKARLREQDAVVISGGDWDRWDLQVRGGALASTRLRLAIEEHGSGRQLVRVRWWPHPSRLGLGLIAALGALALLTVFGSAGTAAIALACLAGVVAIRLVLEYGAANAALAALVSATELTERREELTGRVRPRVAHGPEA